MSRGRDGLTWLPGEDEGVAPGDKPADADPEPPTLAFDRHDRFRVGDVEFHCSARRGSTADRFYIRKDRALVEEYLDVLDDFPEANAVELGIAEGGSVALMAMVSPPGSWLRSIATRSVSNPSTS